MSYDFYAFIARMKYIKRWSLMRSVTEENIMEHSFMVTTIAHALGLIRKEIFNKEVDLYKLLTYAQYHETGEVITGDLPTPIKYFNPDITTAYKALEKTSCEKLIKRLPKELQVEYTKAILPDENCLEYKLTKCADRICALIKCIEETIAGNSEFSSALSSIKEDIVKKFDLEECKYFLENILPAFYKTLDDLQ